MSQAVPIDDLLDILDLIGRIERQTAAITRDQFLDDTDIQDATAYRLLAIGEASKGIDDEMKARNPQVPWRQILGMRNFLAHEYFIRESELIWETIKIGLPDLATVRRTELQRLGYQP
ncbi:MAG TPA: HepT-like ribonuclease domain-containing protein [Stellaceae bacterium]|nr:HepT-like ribonuclease domain-containing protein [Stellaceae bacterium]